MKSWNLLVLYTELIEFTSDPVILRGLTGRMGVTLVGEFQHICHMKVSESWKHFPINLNSSTFYVWLASPPFCEFCFAFFLVTGDQFHLPDLTCFRKKKQMQPPQRHLFSNTSVQPEGSCCFDEII